MFDLFGVIMVIVCVLVVITSGMLGYFLGDKYRKRKEFYNQLVNFANFIEPHINFYNTKLTDLFDDFDSQSKIFNAFKIQAKEHIVNSSVTISCLGFLKESEKEDVLHMLKTLTCLDFENIQRSLKGFKVILEQKANDATNEAKIKINLYQKLSLFLGLALAIILI